MMVPPTIYCIDTSSIVKWFVEVYPPKIFVGLQDRIEDLIAQGRLQSPKAVFDEIKAGDDCHLWAKTQTRLFFEEPLSVQQIVRRLMATHHDPIKPRKGISGADPFVIAMAKNGGANWKVVCDEHPGSQENRKIPFVCRSENVDCIPFLDLMIEEGWQFH
jgi:Domain of unknown function (DUF4411)